MTIDAGTCFLTDEKATLAFGAALARCTGGRGLLTLRGNLGSGKTTLCRGLLRALGHTGPVKSPTYTLVEPYEIGELRVFHYDLYRLNDPAELEYLGLRDFIDDFTLTLIEWPEKAYPLLPLADLELNLQVSLEGRQLSWHALTPYGNILSAALTLLAEQLVA